MSTGLKWLTKNPECTAWSFPLRQEHVSYCDFSIFLDYKKPEQAKTPQKQNTKGPQGHAQHQNKPVKFKSVFYSPAINDMASDINFENAPRCFFLNFFSILDLFHFVNPQRNLDHTFHLLPDLTGLPKKIQNEFPREEIL